MQQAEFETGLKSDGYTDIETRSIDPRPENSEHAHDYDIRGLVLGGLFTVRQEGKAQSYRSGEVFAVPANRKHTEEIGSEGARIIVGKKYHGR